MHVLLAEPHLPLAKPLLRGLEEEGIVTDLARDAAEAGRMALAVAYDALLVNWRLPASGGADLVRSLRHGGLVTPVLMIVPSEEARHCREAVAAGADDCLPLPFPLAELLTRLRALRLSFDTHPPGSPRVS